jgi:hypothetical protein
MTDMNLGTTGAKRQSWAHDNPRDVLLGLIKANKSWNERRIFDAFFDEVVGNENYMKVILEYWFANNYASLIGKRKQRKPSTGKLETAATVSTKINDRIEREAQTLLLEWTMPNGKRLADCTGSDCKKVGGWLSRIADKIKPTDIVGRVLSEKQVRSLYATR